MNGGVWITPTLPENVTGSLGKGKWKEEKGNIKALTGCNESTFLISFSSFFLLTIDDHFLLIYLIVISLVLSPIVRVALLSQAPSP